MSRLAAKGAASKDAASAAGAAAASAPFPFPPLSILRNLRLLLDLLFFSIFIVYICIYIYIQGSKEGACQGGGAGQSMKDITR